MVYNPRPGHYTSVSYTGLCSFGNAEGSGKVTWYVGSTPVAEYEGDFSGGRMDGTGTLKSLDGLYTVSGQWRNGHPVDVIAEADPPVVREVLPTDTLLTVGKEPDVDLFALQKLLVFPEEARINDIDGKIRVRVLVTSTTQIAQVKVSEASHPIFVLPAIDAIFRSDFVRSPARLDDGKAVPIWLTVPIQFNFR